MWNASEETRYAYTVLVDDTEGKRSLGGNQLMWKDNIKLKVVLKK